MPLDLVIRNGQVVDGTGAPARRADVAVRDGRIVAVGDVDEPAARTVDADGLVVAPGFIDMHTHYDAQIFWDRTLHPSPLHGITTVVAGNCGYTLAPVADADQAWLLALLARVEEIPSEALAAGVDVTWNDYAGYLDAVDGPLGVNAGFYVGHSPIRRAVMGAAATGEKATPEQIAAMRRLVSEALGAGALGFSTAIQAQHVDGDDRPTPSQFAAFDEIAALAEVCGDHPGTFVQMTPTAAPPPEEQRRLLAEIAVRSKRPLFYLLAQRHEQLSVVDEVRRAGGIAYCQVFLQQGMATRQEFGNSLLLRFWPSPWPEVMALPLEDKLQALTQPELRARLRAALDTEAGASYRDRWATYEVNDVSDPAMQHLIGRAVTDIAAARGIDAFDATLDLVVEARTEIGFITIMETAASDAAARADQVATLADRRSLWGASDAGAHVGFLPGQDAPSRMLSALVRDQGAFTVEQVVHNFTGLPAARMGLVDRGTIAPGNWADITVFDPERVSVSRPQFTRDWPGGAGHIFTTADGYDRVLVNGTEVVVGGRYTGDLPGRVLRSGRDTRTASAVY